MAFITTAQKTALKAQLLTYQNMLATAQAELAIAYTKPDDYKFDSGEGSQRVKSRPLQDIEKSIRFLEGRIGSISKRLNGTGIVTLQTKRYGAGSRGRY